MFGVVNIACLAASPDNYVWLAFSLVRGQVEMNCVLTCLNARHLWKTGLPFVHMGERRSFLGSHASDHMTTLDILIEKSATTESHTDANGIADDTESTAPSTTGKIMHPKTAPGLI